MKLLVFPHSHYCEKARWALDHKGLAFAEVPLMPGFHMSTVRRYASDTCVPVLLNDGMAVQGSSEIIDYLEQQFPSRARIYQSYVISAARVERARREFDVAMAETERKLGGRDYLVGDRFTRADLSVASMLSLLVMPPEHPFPWREIPDAQTRAFLDDYRRHPVFEWVRNTYRLHRLSAVS